MTSMSSLELMTPWRLLRSLRKTPFTLQTVLGQVTTDQTRREPAEVGEWSIIEVLCHLRDYETIFHQRVILMLAEDIPQLPIPESNEYLAEIGEYKKQELSHVLTSLLQTRQEFLQTLENLSEEQWMRTGIHGEQFLITVKEAVLQVIMHDIDHCEQIARLIVAE